MVAKVTWQKLTLKLRNPFRLSYGTSETRQAYWLRLWDESGWGEGTIPPYYGVDHAEMEAVWRRAANHPLDFPETPSEIPAWIGDGVAPARCALDLALHDRIAKKMAVPLYQLLGLPYPKPKASSFTISLDTPEQMALMATQVPKFPIIKVKLGGDETDLARLTAIRRARPDVKLWVDANAGWHMDQALAYLPDLESIGLEMLEQPLPKQDFSGMGKLQAATSIKIVADESVQTLDDVEKLAAAGVGGINIKLMKVGGLTPALEMIRRARALGLGVMLGCMIETAIGVTAMAQLMGVADWLDLDAPALITNDPFDGLVLDEHFMVHIPERPGIGVILKGEKQSTQI